MKSFLRLLKKSIRAEAMIPFILRDDASRLLSTNGIIVSKHERTLTKALSSSKGYTLIEILIVLFIISIITTVALLSIGHNENKQLESFANEFVQTLTLAEEQAMLQPTVLGLLLDKQSFHFASLQASIGNSNKTNWEPLNDTLLGMHAIPKNVEILVEVGNQRNLSTNDETNEVNNNPQIIISTNGDITPFTIYIGKVGEKPRYAIQGDADGHITNKALS